MALTKATYSMILGAPINVLDYGAKGDGTTNDTAAIVAAIAACQASRMKPSGPVEPPCCCCCCRPRAQA